MNSHWPISMLTETFTRLHGSAKLPWTFGIGTALLVSSLIIARQILIRSRCARRSKRALMLTQYLGVGGLERMVLNVSQTLQAEHGWLPSVFVFDHPPNSPPESHLGSVFEKAGIPVVLYSKPRGFSIRAVFKIAWFLRKGEFEVLHSHDLGALIYAVGAKLVNLGRIRLVHTQHSFVHLQRKKRYELYERLFTRFVDELSVVSEDTRDTYIRLGIAPNKIHVVTNGVQFANSPSPDSSNLHRIRQQLLSQPELDLSCVSARNSLRRRIDSTWVLYMARLHGRKGQEHAVSLWNELRREVRESLTLVFVGMETEPGQLQRLSERISGAQSSEQIFYLGPTHTPHLWLSAADISISCSEFEGMPLGPIEAGGSGLPLILSDIPGHEALRGFSRQYSLGKPAAGAALLEEILNELRQEGSGSRMKLWKQAQPIRDQFSLQAMAKKYSLLYRAQGGE